MLSSLSKREKILLGILALIIIIAPYYFYVYVPYQERIEEYQEEKGELETELAVTRVYVMRLPELLDKLDELEQEVARIKEEDYSNEGLMHYLLDTGREYNVKLISYNPTVRRDGIAVNGVLEGDFNAIISFIKQFEEDYFKFNYNNINIRPRDNLLELQISFVHQYEDNGGDRS